jgi:hypothetical protein
MFTFPLVGEVDRRSEAERVGRRVIATTRKLFPPPSLTLLHKGGGNRLAFREIHTLPSTA